MQMDSILGPYNKGLGKRRRSHTDVSTDEEVPDENFFLHPQEICLPKKRRVNHLEADIVPKFDPGKKSTNVKGWLNKIDQLGDMYTWDERDRIFVMQVRLRGAAREWYDDLDDYGASWAQWKENLTKAFPRSTDYVDRLEEMLGRTKSDSETMTKYFHEKMSLIKKCELKGDAATSCLIRGLPTELRANAKAYNCTSPEELYYGFLSSLENYKNIEAKVTETKTSWQRGYDLPRTCFLCRKHGHEARDCRRCEVCLRVGHKAATCWFAAGAAGSTLSGGEHSAQTPRNVTQTQKNTDALPDRRGTRPMQDGRVLRGPTSSI
ncbi:uncharacterized protein LOC112043480 [Bicyclus anynana]|uniref:Uncharacterized protein LOC112043480 n=1 Tax=Bicyclus anynana TaxID=110368 RepID=A0ABM3M0C8_BICAN|nr:uncharacterized protein LOC112043480 [Bicyclus anynana]